jgi:hypothetical protein
VTVIGVAPPISAAFVALRGQITAEDAIAAENPLPCGHRHRVARLDLGRVGSAARADRGRGRDRGREPPGGRGVGTVTP